MHRSHSMLSLYIYTLEKNPGFAISQQSAIVPQIAHDKKELNVESRTHVIICARADSHDIPITTRIRQSDRCSTRTRLLYTTERHMQQKSPGVSFHKLIIAVIRSSKDATNERHSNLREKCH